QNIFTFTKIAAIVFLIVSGLWYILTSEPVAAIAQQASPDFNLAIAGTMCVALVGSIFSADAWNNVTFTGSEIEKPERNLPLSLIIGTTTVLGIYIFINWVYLQVLPFGAIQSAENDRVGTVLLETVFGNIGL